MPHPDPETCHELTQLSAQIKSIDEKLDRFSSDFNKQLSDFAKAFPNGVEQHREAHQAMIDAKKAEAEFYIDLKQMLIKRGILAAIVLIGGFMWVGIEQYIKLHLK